MKAIPLRSPDGIIYSYACGICHNVQGGTAFGLEVKDLAEEYRRQAEECCRCTRCRDRPIEGAPMVLFGGFCAECAPLAEEENARREAHLKEMRQILGERREKALRDAKDRDSAESLLRVMEEISQEHWSAGWLLGLEYDLWSFVGLWRTGLLAKRGSKFGMFELENKTLTDLSELSERAGGWWKWFDDEQPGAYFVPMQEWLAIFSERELSRSERAAGVGVPP